MNQQNIFTAIADVFRYFYRKDSEVDQNEFPHWLIPVAGLIPGLLIAVISAAFVFLMGRVAGGIMTALTAPLILEILSGWRGISLTVAYLERMFSGKKNGEVSSDKMQNEWMQHQILFASIYLFRMAVFGVLAASGNAVWFIYVLGGAYLIRGELIRENEVFDSSDYGIWLFYGFFSLIAGLFAFHLSGLAAFPLALFLTVLCLIGCRRCMEKWFDQGAFWAADLLGYLSENIMLIVGLFLFGRLLHG